MSIIIRNCIVQAALCMPEVWYLVEELWSHIQRIHKRSADCKTNSDQGELIAGWWSVKILFLLGSCAKSRHRNRNIFYSPRSHWDPIFLHTLMPLWLWLPQFLPPSNWALWASPTDSFNFKKCGLLFKMAEWVIIVITTSHKHINIKNQRDILAAEVPTPDSLGKGTSAGERFPHTTWLWKQVGIASKDMKASGVPGIPL